jgi:nucleoside-diphosphate-sugar epimerase
VLEGPIAVTGSTGFVGKALVSTLVERGNSVRALVRKLERAETIDKAGVQLEVGDLSDLPSLERLVTGCSAVVHLAAVADSSNASLNQEVNVTGSRNLVRACKSAGVSRIINVSSTCAGRTKRDCYGQTKLEAEQEFTQDHLVTTHLRPTMIYGHGSKEFDLFAKLVAHLPRLPIPGSGSSLLRPVYLDDFLDLVLRVLDADLPANQIFDVAGPETIRVDDFVEILGRVQGNRARVFKLPAGPTLMGVRLLGRIQRHPFVNVDQVLAFLQDTCVDIQPARNQLSWDPRPLEEGLSELFGRTP